MLTLVIPGREDAERDAVATAWVRRGWTVCRLERFWEPPVLERTEVRLYGDMTFCLFLAEKLGLELTSPPDDLLLHIHPKWLGRRVQGLTLAEALRQPYPLFVKPIIPKAFRASIYEDESVLQKEIEGLPIETPIIMSELVTFTSEVRCLVLRGDVVSSAVYEGEAKGGEAEAFAREFIKAYPIAVTLILDVGWIVGYGWAVIEANSIWGGGLNGCDADKMVDCLALATRPSNALFAQVEV